MNQEYIDKDKVLVRTGDVVDRIYFLLSGELNIFTEIRGREVLFDSPYQGSCIGIYGILSDAHHVFTVRTNTNVNMHYIAKESFRVLLNTYIDLDKEIKKTKQYFDKKGYPLIDFKYFYSTLNGNATKQRLKACIKRLQTISHALISNS